MNHTESVKSLWNDIGQQNWNSLSGYFHSDAVIEWPNTDEIFTVDNFIRANSEYPGKWLTEIKRLETTGNFVVSVTLVCLEKSEVSFYTTSFFEFDGEKIKNMIEYWSENSSPPEWRRQLLHQKVEDE